MTDATAEEKKKLSDTLGVVYPGHGAPTVKEIKAGLASELSV